MEDLYWMALLDAHPTLHVSYGLQKKRSPLVVSLTLARLWNNSGTAGGQPVFAQYLKDSKNPKYSISQINTYPTTTSGFQVFATMVFAWTSDGAFKGRRWPAIVIGSVSVLATHLIAAVLMARVSI